MKNESTFGCFAWYVPSIPIALAASATCQRLITLEKWATSVLHLMQGLSRGKP
jgi:hypothetical protein